jgi:hypothetical protein
LLRIKPLTNHPRPHIDSGGRCGGGTLGVPPCSKTI